MNIPRATIRLQLNGAFTLDHATEIVPYLTTLGISHIYASPILTAQPGSMHGYDVTDPTTINPELGGRAALDRLSGALKAQQMGLIVDIVPNHMAATDKNPWWFDVLEFGSSSRYAGYFDIDWQPRRSMLHDKVLAPWLGSTLSEALAANEISLVYEKTHRRFLIRYYDQHLPVSPFTYSDILQYADASWRPHASAFDIKPSAATPEQASADPFDAAHARLAEHIDRSDPSQLEHILAQFASRTSMGRRALDGLLAKQHYHLCCWRDASTQINWRRFFDINGLVALRMDRPQVFEAYHSSILALYEEGIIDGVRVDHIDGLAEPRSYCRKLRRELKKVGRRRRNVTDNAFIIVEKILDQEESLPADWQVDGTTGYDFMNDVSAVLHDPAGQEILSTLWIDLTHRPGHFPVVACEARREIVQKLFIAPLNALTLALSGDDSSRHGRPPPAARYRECVVELLANFTRYRLYGGRGGLSKEDKHVLNIAEHAAAQALLPEQRATLRDICAQLGAVTPHSSPGRKRVINLKAMRRFQQLSATLAAKAVEDTAFYRFAPLLSRNEVGADPTRLAITPSQFHERCRRRASRHPRTLLATATHDHKRGEDLRSRLAVLSEKAVIWQRYVRDWVKLHEAAGQRMGDLATQLMIYQMIVGAWPLDLAPDDTVELGVFRSRLEGWLIKSVREAKLQTSWDLPNSEFEHSCQTFLGYILDADQSTAFLQQAYMLVGDIAAAGVLNSLAQTTLRLTVPGIPDLYQGTELWDFSLVDPDNRRPVDFIERQRSLSATSLGDLLKTWRNGHIKQWLIARLLNLRRRHPDLFARGSYTPLAVSGDARDRVIAFAREFQDTALIVVTPRCCAGLIENVTLPVLALGDWADSAVHFPASLPASRLTDVIQAQERDFSGNVLPLASALRPFPIGVWLLGGS